MVKYLLVTTAIFIAACNESPTHPNLTVPSPVTIVVKSTELGTVKTLDISLDGAASIRVDYWHDSGMVLRQISSVEDTSHRVVLAQMLQNRLYQYEVTTYLESADGTSLTGSFMTDSLDTQIDLIGFTVTGQSTVPMMVLETRPGPWSGFLIITTKGEAVWHYRVKWTPQGMTRRANGNFVFLDTDLEEGLIEVHATGEVVNRLLLSGHAVISGIPYDIGGHQIHHEVISSNDNSLLYLGKDNQTFFDTVWAGDAIYEWNPSTGQSTKVWSPFDFFTPLTDRGARSRPDDWMHANSLSIGPRGNILMSLHYFDQILSIKADYSALEWRLGGVNSTITEEIDAVHSGQHTAVEVTENHVLMFDNGFTRTDGTLYSRALEIEIDLATQTASKYWEFRPAMDNYSQVISSARRLDNGNTIVAFGSPSGILQSTGSIELFEVTSDGNIIWHMVIEGPSNMYRGTPLYTLAGETLVPN